MSKDNILSPAFLLPYMMGVVSAVLIILVLTAAGVGSITQTQIVTIVDKMPPASNPYGGKIITCDQVMFVNDDITYSKLQIGHTYTLTTKRMALSQYPTIESITKSNDAPQNGCGS